MSLWSNLCTLIIYTNSCIGLLCNLLLAYLIQRNQKVKIGNYRYLLLLLTFFDMMYICMQMLVAPTPYLYKHSWNFVQTGQFILQNNLAYWADLLYCSFFIQSLVLIMFHFVHRYIAICRAALLPKLHTPIAIFLCLCAYVFAIVVWSVVLCLTFYGPPADYLGPEFEELFGFHPSQTQIMGGVYMSTLPDGSLSMEWKSWIGLSVLVSVLGFTFTVIIFCAYQMHKTLYTSKISIKSHNLQRQLFKTLIIQTCVPLVLEYTPCTAILFLPIIGWAPNMEWPILCYTVYPIIEPLVVIYFVRDYRESFKNLFRRSRTTTPKASSIAPYGHTNSKG